MKSLETERLILRPWEPEDAGFVLDLYSRWEGSALHRQPSTTAPANAASQRVCLRIGMTHRGQTNRYYNATCELFEAVPD